MSLSVCRDLDDLRAGLERWLGRSVGSIERPTPGWSCETLIVEDVLVIRLPPLSAGIFPSYDLEQQAAVQNAVGAAGVPVAGPARYEPDAAFLGDPFVAMPFVAGRIPGEFTPADGWLLSLPNDAARRSLWHSFLAAVGEIHGTDHRGLGLRAGLAAELDYWDHYLLWATEAAPPPALAEALGWCRANRPKVEPAPSLLWGDVRLGNVIFAADTPTPLAVIDWDMASVGPAEMDVGWFLALETLQTTLTGLAMPGFGTHSDAVAALERGIARPLADLAWYEVFALVRASAISTRIARLFQAAGQASPFRVGEDPTLAAALARIERA